MVATACHFEALPVAQRKNEAWCFGGVVACSAGGGDAWYSTVALDVFGGPGCRGGGIMPVALWLQVSVMVFPTKVFRVTRHSACFQYYSLSMNNL